MWKFEQLGETRLTAAVGGDDAVGCGIFPGLCKNADGSLALLLVSGSGFESADQRLVAFTGTADGLNWREAGPLSAIVSHGAAFTAAAKPTLLADGRLMALGYGFERNDQSETISGYAEKNGEFPTVRNAVWFSSDCGKSYSEGPVWLDLNHEGVEFSGPALRLTDGRLLAFGPPFNLNKHGQLGCCFESNDGCDWREKSIFFDGDAITAWECRGLELSDGRIAVVFWAFDLMLQKHLSNRISISDDGGASWRVSDTKLPGQAANLVDFGWDDGGIGLLQARREKNAPGIYLTRINLTGDAVILGETVKLYDAAGGANADMDITGQFYSLKFGQPALHRLIDGNWLLVFWRCTPVGEYEVVIRKLAIENVAIPSPACTQGSPATHRRERRAAQPDLTSINKFD